MLIIGHVSPSLQMLCTPMALHGLKRTVMSVQIGADDRFIFCGTSSGDILVIFIKSLILAHIKTIKQFSGRGITCLTYCQDKKDGQHYLLAGVGSGQLGLLLLNTEDGTLRLERMTKLNGAITSISNGYDHEYSNGSFDTFVGTNKGNQYLLDSRSLEWQLRLTAHYEPIHDICFPPPMSQSADDLAVSSMLFATCSNNDIRIWLSDKKQEALRIQVSNPLAFTHSLTHSLTHAFTHTAYSPALLDLGFYPTSQCGVDT